MQATMKHNATRGRLCPRLGRAVATVAAAAVLASCDMMHDDRSDCPFGLYLSFEYDYNLERADMFADHVGAVDVYVFDEQGRYVTCQSEANVGDDRPLAQPGYAMHMDLQPGRYQFVVLAGQTDYDSQLSTRRAHFVRSQLVPGDDMQTLDVRLDTRDDGTGTLLVPHGGEPLDTLWHGLHVEPVEVFTEKPTYATVPLVRDTKKINVTLRDIDEPWTTDVAQFDMRITDRNAHLLWDNTVDESAGTVVYTPHATWNTTDRTADSRADGETQVQVGRIAHADFMTSRIIYHDDPADDAILSVTSRETGQEVIRINLPDLLSRLRTSESAYSYSPQEFLDRGYDYQLDFFLKGGRLAYANIRISVLEWSVRVQFADL